MSVVIINKHEPEGEVAGRLLELNAEKGHNPSEVVAQRGEHDANLSFRVPDDVAEAFESDRAERWPSPELTGEPSDTDDQNTPPARTKRPGKAQTSQE